jgi:hypothetical protein
MKTGTSSGSGKSQVLSRTPSPEAIRGFSEEAAINIISSTLHDNAGSINNNCSHTFNPVDKWMKALAENKALYERLLKEKKEKIALLEKLAGEKKK